jgi:hypothetical protein
VRRSDDEPASSITRVAAAELESTDKGIAIAARGSTPIVDPFDTPMMNAVLVRWHDLLRISLIDPWPCFRLRWRTRDGKSEDVFGPAEGESESAFSFAVSRLVEATTRRGPLLVSRGWLDVAPIEWEPVSDFPVLEQVVTRHDGGAFRTSAREVESQVVGVLARRGAPSTFDALLSWLHASPARPLSRLPQAVLVTADEDVYVRWRDQSCARIPLAALRVRIDVRANAFTESDDAFYVFGRATRLLLLRRRQCEVAALFDERLTQERSIATARKPP